MAQKINSQKGQSIIEALISLSVAVVIISAITLAVIASVNNSDFGKNQNLASEYARQGIEKMRQQSQSDWATFSGRADQTYCFAQSDTTLNGVAPCAQNIKNSSGANFFVRQVKILHVASNGPLTPTPPNCAGNMDITVTVSWADGKCNSSNAFCHKVALESCVSNLNSKTTP